MNVASISSCRQQELSLNQVQFFRLRCTSGALLLKKEQYFCSVAISIFSTESLEPETACDGGVVTKTQRNASTKAATDVITGEPAILELGKSVVKIDEVRCYLRRSGCSVSSQNRTIIYPVFFRHTSA